MKPASLFTVWLIAFVAFAAPAAQAAEPRLDGMYAAEGADADGNLYEALVKIVRHGESYFVAWLFRAEAGEEIILVVRSAGVGVVNNGMLAVSFYGQDSTGIILYQIENGGQRLAGRWVSATGDGAVLLETLTRVPGTQAPGVDAPPRPAAKKPIRTVASTTGVR